jgi:hypothetical protein
MNTEEPLHERLKITPRKKREFLAEAQADQPEPGRGSLTVTAQMSENSAVMDSILNRLCALRDQLEPVMEAVDGPDDERIHERPISGSKVVEELIAQRELLRRIDRHIDSFMSDLRIG